MKLPSQQIKPYLLLLPSLLFLIVFLGYGSSQVVLESLKPATGLSGWTLANYQELLSSDIFFKSFIYTIVISVISTVISLTFGLILTRIIYFYFADRKLYLTVWIPMLIPHFVAAYLIALFFSQSGLISGLFYHLDLISEPTQFPELVNDQLGIGIILAYIWKEVPFVILMLLPVYYRLNKELFEVARSLGGNGWQVFKSVEWPQIFPTLIETGLILFSFILAAYEVPYLLGVTYPKALPVLGYQWFFEGDWSNRPKSMSLFAIITALVLALTYLLLRISQQKRYQSTRGR